MSHHTSLFAARDDHDEVGHRRAANRALVFSALVLAAAGGVELLVALVTHSVGLLGDALHNLSDVSTSALVFVGFRVSRRPATDRYRTGTHVAKTWPVRDWQRCSEVARRLRVGRANAKWA